MRAVEVTIKQLFSGSVEFIAPSFQRPYSWIRASAQRVLDGVWSADPAAHFVGAVVSMDIGTFADGHAKSLLVDGNHRLITVLLMILAVRDRVAACDAHWIQTVNETCFIKTDSRGQIYFKNILPRKDQKVFKALVFGAPTPSPGSALLRTYRFMFDALQGRSCNELTAAMETLFERFTFVLLSLERNENPYPIFKLLNVPGEAFTLKGLKEYDRFSRDPELMALIAGGESLEVEFKESAVQHDKRDSVGSLSVVRAVAGFLNSFHGGTLLIGVRDDGTIRGIEKDYAIADHGKANWDGFNLYMHNMLRMRLSVENPFLFYTIERRQVADHDLCLIRIKPANAPVYIDKHLYVRSGCQTIDMLGPDLVHYVAARWPATQAGAERRP